MLSMKNKKTSFLFTICSILLLNLSLSCMTNGNENSRLPQIDVDSELDQNKSSENKNSTVNNYRIAFIQQGNIWSMIEDGTDKRQLTQSGNVIALSVKNKVIYYSEVMDENLDVYSFDTKSNKRNKIVTIKGSVEEFTKGDIKSGGEISWINNNNIGIWANYECCSAAGFKNLYSINLDSKEVKQIQMIDGDMNERVSIQPSNPFEFKIADEKGKMFFSKKVGREYELFYRKDGGEVIKVSNTQDYSPRTCWGDKVKDFSYLTTPTKKVIFSFILECGDLAHSVLHISNMDGTYQVGIDSDVLYNRNDFSILRSNGEFVILKYDQQSEMTNLVAYIGQKNQQQIIMKDVNYFELIY